MTPELVRLIMFMKNMKNFGIFIKVPAMLNRMAGCFLLRLVT